jgi:hypothetical protein
VSFSFIEVSFLTLNFTSWREISPSIKFKPSRHTPIIIVPGFSLFNRRVAKQSKALGQKWNYWAFSLELRQPDLGTKQYGGRANDCYYTVNGVHFL